MSTTHHRRGDRTMTTPSTPAAPPTVPPSGRIPTVNIELEADAVGGRLLVNGLELTNLVASDWKLTSDPVGDPVLTVGFVGPIFARVDGVVELDEATTTALLALGWTPPAAGPVHAEECDMGDDCLPPCPAATTEEPTP